MCSHRPVRLVRVRGRRPAERADVPGAGARGHGGPRASMRWPSVERDLLGVSTWARAGSRRRFYHHRFLRPAAAAQARISTCSAGSAGGDGSRGRRPRRRPAVGGSSGATSLTCWSSAAGAAGCWRRPAAAEAGARVVVLEAERGRRSIRAAGRGAGPRRRRAAHGSVATGWYGGMVTAIGRRARIWRSVPARSSRRPASTSCVPTVPGADRPGRHGCAARPSRLLARMASCRASGRCWWAPARSSQAAGAALREAGARRRGSGPDACAALHRRARPVAWALRRAGGAAGRDVEQRRTVRASAWSSWSSAIGRRTWTRAGRG